MGYIHGSNVKIRYPVGNDAVLVAVAESLAKEPVEVPVERGGGAGHINKRFHRKRTRVSNAPVCGSPIPHPAPSTPLLCSTYLQGA